MIKLDCNRKNIHVDLEGTGITIMSELCVIVESICEKFTEDDENAKEFKYLMMVEVANALKRKVKDDMENCR